MDSTLVTFSAAPHEIVLGLLFQLAVLLLLARAFGEAARTLGQPSVVGELVAGIVLGPSLLGALSPFVELWLIPDAGPQGWLLESAGMLGAMFLLLITGMETDLVLLRRHSRTAAGTSIGGIAIPFASGFVLGLYLPAVLLGAATERIVFALFIATALSISAIPVIARVLMDMDLMRRDLGQTILAAGIADDAIGWIMLSIVAGLASGGALTLSDAGLAIGRVLGFLLVSFTIGGWLVGWLIDWVRRRGHGPFVPLSVVAGLMFGWAALAHLLALEAVFGAFVMGMLLGREKALPGAVHDQTRAIAFGVFTPIFFATAGLKVNARALADPALLGIALLVVGVATFGKVAGGYLGGRWIGGRDRWTSLAFGIGMNARGAIGIVMATVGLNLGIISADMFSIIVLMAIVTSLMAAPGLRWVLRRVRPEPEESERLRREARARGSRVARMRRVLVPLRRREQRPERAPLEAALLERLGGDEPLDVTLFNVAEPGGRAASRDFLQLVARHYGTANVTRRVEESDAADVAILEEAARGYDLLLLGARGAAGTRDALFHPFIDRVVRLAPCASIVLHGAPHPAAWPPRRILVPTSGSHASVEAADLAFRLAAGDDVVVILNVVPSEGDDAARFGTLESEERRLRNAEDVVAQLREHGAEHQVHVLPIVRVGADVDDVILQVAAEVRADLLVLGTAVRAGSGRLFLGPRVERLLERASCPVLVYNAAPAPGVD